MPILASFVSGFQKSVFFAYVNYECQKLHVKKVTTSHLPGFGPLHSQIYRYCFETCYMFCLYVSLQHIFRFFNNTKILDFIGIYFLKNKFLNFWGQNREK